MKLKSCRMCNVIIILSNKNENLTFVEGPWCIMNPRLDFEFHYFWHFPPLARPVSHIADPARVKSDNTREYCPLGTASVQTGQNMHSECMVKVPHIGNNDIYIISIANLELYYKAADSQLDGWISVAYINRKPTWGIAPRAWPMAWVSLEAAPYDPGSLVAWLNHVRK